MALTLGQLLDAVLSRAMADLHTAFPARVESYDASKQVVNVQPLLRARVRDEEGAIGNEDLPVLTNVPVVFGGGGTHRLTFPIQKGDTVLVVVAEASLERWKKQGGKQEVEDGRRFHLADAIAVPGLHDNTKAWKNADGAATTLGKDDGMRLVVKDTTMELGDGATEPVILGKKYTDDEAAMLDSVTQQITQITAQLGTAGAALSAAAAANAVPMVGGMMASPQFVTVSTQLVQMATALAQVNAALGQFRGKLSAALSQEVTTK